MSCDRNRERFFAAVANESALTCVYGSATAALRALNDLFDSAQKKRPQPFNPVVADAMTRQLFKEMKEAQMTPPTHSADGLPRVASRQGYAQVYQAITDARRKVSSNTPSGRSAGEAPTLRTASIKSTSQGQSIKLILTDGEYLFEGGTARQMTTFAKRLQARGYGTYDSTTRTFTASVDSTVMMQAQDHLERIYGTKGGTSIVLKTPDKRLVERPILVGSLRPDEPVPGTLSIGELSMVDRAEAALGRLPDRDVALILGIANAQHTTPGKDVHILGRLAVHLIHYCSTGTLTTKVALYAWAEALRQATFIHPHASTSERIIPTVYGFAKACAAFMTDRRMLSRCPACGRYMSSEKGSHECPSNAYLSDGYNALGIGRNGQTRYGTYADGTPVPADQRQAPELTPIDLAAQRAGYADPLNNASVIDVWSRVATTVAGHTCSVELEPGGGFATDMKGKIYADPYPCGVEAPQGHNLITTRAGIIHEIGHELVTPPEDWEHMLAIAAGTIQIDGIDALRSHVPMLYNVIEDGRMERELSRRFMGAEEVLRGAAAVYPRWDEQVGTNVPLADQVIGAMLYTALPYFTVSDEVRDAMSPEAHTLFEQLEPIVRQGVSGTSEDSAAATIMIAQALEAAGVVSINEGTVKATPPGGQQTGQQGQAGGQQTGQQAGQQTGQQAGQQAGQDTERAVTYGNKSSLAPDVQDIITRMQNEMTSVMDGHVRSKLIWDNLGKPLLAASPRSHATSTQEYRSVNGDLAHIETEFPLNTASGINPRKDIMQPPERVRIAASLARHLDSIRSEAEQRIRNDDQGSLDRRRFVQAMTGRTDVRTRMGSQPETGMAVSVLLDQSGSMARHVGSGDVYTTAAIMGTTFQQLQMPYEVRGHGDSSRQYKSIGDAEWEEQRFRRLLTDGGGGNQCTAPVAGLATAALLASPEANKLIVNVMDGDMGDHMETVKQYQHARQEGIVTVGVFLGNPSSDQAERMSEIFGGVSNWRPIGSLTELPDVIGRRITDIFDSLQ